MNSTTIYVKNFKEIHRLQEEKTVIYNLLEESTVPISEYGIGITSKIGALTESDQYLNISASKNEAICILTYLYDNSVTLSNWKDVATDLMDKLHRLN